MNGSALKNSILSGDYDAVFAKLYGDTAAARARYADACTAFETIFGTAEELRLFSAPGRTEISGNHTDHQHGCVLAGSVDLDVIAVVAPRADRLIRVQSAGFPMDTVDINNLEIVSVERGSSAALIRGVCAAFSSNGFEIGGFDAYTTSNVLKGSGLSSSAAFEVLIAVILNGLYNHAAADAVSIAKFAQFSEREYFGKPCGLLDQMASAVGGFTYADFRCPSEPVIEKINLDLRQFGYTLCVVDTGGNHADLTQDYADITLECAAVSRALGVEFLRDADWALYRKKLPALRTECGDRAVLRAFHFFHEQQRVEQQRAALKSGDFNAFLQGVNASGESSYQYLQNLYSNSNPQQQGLPLALALTKDFLQGSGACRVHGGGFAGTVQCYIPNGQFAAYRERMDAVFGAGACVALNIRPVGGCELTIS